VILGQSSLFNHPWFNHPCSIIPVQSSLVNYPCSIIPVQSSLFNHPCLIILC
jgi:hypothetical protein